MVAQAGETARDGNSLNFVPGRPVELVVLSIKTRAARCRLLGDDRIVTFRNSDVWKLTPGYIVTVAPREHWIFGNHPHLSGDIIDVTLDVTRLGLHPLGLQQWGMWDPGEEYWGDADDPLMEWGKAMVAEGPRPTFEMEQVVPGKDLTTWDDDPIMRAVELWHSGYGSEAYDLLNGLCEEDLRCLDAHSHLGNWSLDDFPDDALRHYEVGMRIGELSLKGDFNGVLPWSLIDNRPFLRCVHGVGLALWRLDRFEEAEAVFQRLIRLNPSDNQGARFNLGEVRARRSWVQSE